MEKNFEFFKVLVLEDSPAAMEDVCLKLEQHIHADHIYKAYNPESAIDLLKDTKVDMFFVDLSMPASDGVEFILDFVRHNEELKRAPIVVITATDEDSLIRSALENIVHRYLFKPIKPDELSEALHSVS